MRRRKFLQSAASTLGALVAAPAIVRGLAPWPERPVKLVVPFAPGGSTDLVARPWAEKLTEAFGQQFIIENRGGASGMIGAEAVAKAPADGYTYLLGTSTSIVTLPLLRKVAYDAKAFMPIGRVGDAVTGFATPPVTGLNTLGEMIDYAQKNPGKLAFGSTGTGTAPHLRLELFKLKTGVDILHVPYRGGSDALNDLLAGVIQLTCESASTPHIRAGKLKLLNINYPTRTDIFPGVPTLTELGYAGIDGGSWFGLFGLNGIPRPILERFNAKLVEIGKTPEMQSRLAVSSAVLTPQSLQEVAQHLEDDSKVTAGIIKAADIKLE